MFNSGLKRFLSLAAIAVVIAVVGTTAAYAREVPRLKTDDPAAIQKVRDQIANDSGYSVVFVGDSAVYSSASRMDKDTLASCFSDLASVSRPVNVYDLSLPGCSFVNSYEILKCILPAQPDMVVFDVNIGWFGTTKVEHPGIVK